MKKYLILLLCTCIVPVILRAAEVEGNILLVSGESINVQIYVPTRYTVDEPDYASMQNSITYVNAQGQKHVIKPKLAKSVRFTYNGTDVCMLSEYDPFSLPDSYGSTKVFLKMEIDGRLKLLSYYSIGSYYKNNTGSFYTEHFIIQKDNGDLLNYEHMIFEKDFINVVNDCPQLVHKINNKEYVKKDIVAIVNYYNLNNTIEKPVLMPHSN